MVPGTEILALPPVLHKSSEGDSSVSSKDDENQSKSSNSSNSSHESEHEDSSIDYFGDNIREGDYAVEEFSVHQRVMHFLQNKIDNHNNRQNAEICLLIETRSSVVDEKSTTTVLRNQLMMERYCDLVQGFQEGDFISPSIKVDMALQLFNGKKAMTGECLWKLFEEWRREIVHNTLQSYQKTCPRFQVVIS